MASWLLEGQGEGSLCILPLETPVPQALHAQSSTKPACKNSRAPGPQLPSSGPLPSWPKHRSERAEGGVRGYCPQWRSWEKGRAHLSPGGRQRLHEGGIQAALLEATCVREPRVHVLGTTPCQEPAMASPCRQHLQGVSQISRMSGLEHAPEAIYPTPHFINKQTALAGRRRHCGMTHSLQEFHRSSPSPVLHGLRVVTYASVSHPGPGYFYNVANQHPKRKAFVMF